MLITAGIIAGLPDSDNLANLYPGILKIKLIRLHFDFHEKIHFLSAKKMPLFWKIQSQVVVILSAIFFLLQ